MIPGCHALALDLVKHWSFDRLPAERLLPSERPPPQTVLEGRKENGTLRPSQMTRRSFLGLKASRRQSLIIDMDIPSLPPSLSTTPPPSSPLRTSLFAHNTDSPAPAPTPVVDTDSMARQAGLGSLMKSAKRDVQVPEFDMNAFF